MKHSHKQAHRLHDGKHKDFIFHERLDELLKNGKAADTKTKLTRAELSRRIEISRPTLNQWLSADTQPIAEKVVLICNIYDVSADWLLGRTNIMKRNPSVGLYDKSGGLTEESLSNVNNVSRIAIKKDTRRIKRKKDPSLQSINERLPMPEDKPTIPIQVLESVETLIFTICDNTTFSQKMPGKSPDSIWWSLNLLLSSKLLLNLVNSFSKSLVAYREYHSLKSDDLNKQNALFKSLVMNSVVMNDIVKEVGDQFI
ncbi:hypothetical protein AGMMS49983_20260 [Clostridia bacterium]|nr:hypothetical protein AGMMS49983_20260 [Clostridia bacterium]